MKKVLQIFIITIFIFCLNVNKILAYDGNNYPFEVSIVTDHEQYQPNENINIQITIKNISKLDARNLIIYYDTNDTVNVDDSILAVEDGKIQWKKNILASQETYTINLTGTTVSNLSLDKISESLSVKVETGDDTNYTYYILAIVVTGLCILILVKTKRGKRLLLVVFCSSMIVSQTYTVSEAKSEHYKNTYNKNIIINQNSFMTKLEINCDFENKSDNDIPGSLIIDNQVNKYNVFTTYDDKVTISGSAYDDNGIKQVSYEIVFSDGEKLNGITEKLESWSFEFEPNTGTNVVTVTMVDNLDNTIKKDIKINKLSDSIYIKNNVWVPDKKEQQTINNEILQVFTGNDLSGDFNNDDLILILEKDNQLITQYIEEKNDIIAIPPNDIFVDGFYKKIIGYGDSSYITKLNENILNNKKYIVLTSLNYSDIIDGSLSLDYSLLEFDEQESLNYVTFLDGSYVDYDKDKQIQNSTKKAQRNLNITMADCLNIKKDDSGITLSLNNLKLYDDDNNNSTTEDNVSLEASLKISNINVEGGSEYVEDDFKQNKALISYDSSSNVSLKIGNEVKTDNLLKKIADKCTIFDYFDNKITLTKYLSLSGIKTSDRLYLCSIGFSPSTGFQTGNIENMSNLSVVSPVVVLNVYLKMSITGEVTLEVGTGYNSYNKLGLNIQKNDFNGSYGSVEDNYGDYHTEMFGYSIDIYKNVSKSKYELDEAPESFLHINLTGKTTAEIAPGIEAGIIALGIMPGAIGIDINSSAKAEAKALDIYLYNNKEMEIKSEKFSLEINSGIFLNYAAGCSIKVVGKDLIKIDFNGRNELFNLFNQKFTPPQIKGTIIEYDGFELTEEKKLSGINIKAYCKDTNETFYATSDEQGQYILKDLPYKGKEYEFTFYGKGYADYKTNVQYPVGDNSYQLDIEMYKNTSPVQGTAYYGTGDTDGNLEKFILKNTEIKFTTSKSDESNNYDFTVTTDSEGNFKYDGIVINTVYSIKAVTPNGEISIDEDLSVISDNSNLILLFTVFDFDDSDYEDWHKFTEGHTYYLSVDCDGGKTLSRFKETNGLVYTVEHISNGKTTDFEINNTYSSFSGMYPFPSFQLDNSDEHIRVTVLKGTLYVSPENEYPIPPWDHTVSSLKVEEENEKGFDEYVIRSTPFWYKPSYGQGVKISKKDNTPFNTEDIIYYLPYNSTSSFQTDDIIHHSTAAKVNGKFLSTLAGPFKPTSYVPIFYYVIGFSEYKEDIYSLELYSWNMDIEEKLPPKNQWTSIIIPKSNSNLYNIEYTEEDFKDFHINISEKP